MYVCVICRTGGVSNPLLLLASLFGKKSLVKIDVEGPHAVLKLRPILWPGIGDPSRTIPILVLDNTRVFSDQFFSYIVG